MRTIATQVSCLSLSFLLFSAPSVSSVLEKPVAQSQTPAPAAPVPPGSESGLISNFDDGTANAKFGAGWMVSTDTMAGGTSAAEMKVIEGGANKSKGALEISGTVTNAFTYPWAGVMFSPGATPFAPANLSSKKALHFWARGDSRSYRAMVFTESGGRIPAMKNFNVTSEWKEFTFPLSDFNNTDGHDIQAILFTSSMDPGAFKFAIDEVRLD
ncbi:MAG TPA: CIA30 family protein [Candidatus Sulfotelmatobacter sp.]|jgi:hypothetical protein|nr:CIA30 family protein [Candidatus Sulfotelmatobacter sp.]